MYRRIGKRFLDLIITIPIFLVTSPIMLIVALLVRKRLGMPVLFRQQRPGILGAPFTIIKFRTMTDERDGEGDLLPDEKRLTRFGSFLRRSSLDELPELWNVIKGDMSLVGPRPLLMDYLDSYTPEQARRHDVRPGITGWAQTRGRQSIPFSKRLELDVWYVDHVSFLTDLKILFMTIPTTLQAKGVIPVHQMAEKDDIGLSTDSTKYICQDKGRKS